MPALWECRKYVVSSIELEFEGRSDGWRFGLAASWSRFRCVVSILDLALAREIPLLTTESALKLPPFIELGRLKLTSGMV